MPLSDVVSEVLISNPAEGLIYVRALKMSQKTSFSGSLNIYKNGYIPASSFLGWVRGAGLNLSSEAVFFYLSLRDV